MNKRQETLRPETNNLRRIFIERKYPSMSAMAIELGERPIPFRKYFRLIKPVIPRIDKLERWAKILNIPIGEFFLLGDPVQWPRSLKEHKTVHKKGLSYREAKSLRTSLGRMVAEGRMYPEDISWFLTDE